jgi:hypothetical protein
VCYKLYIGKIVCKSIESISIFHPHEFEIDLYDNFEKCHFLKKIVYCISKISIP